MYFDVTSFHKGCGTLNNDPLKDSRVQIPATCECYCIWQKRKKKKVGGDGDIILDYLGGL